MTTIRAPCRSYLDAQRIIPSLSGTGVGKTAIEASLDGLSGATPESLKNKRVIAMDIGAMIAVVRSSAASLKIALRHSLRR